MRALMFSVLLGLSVTATAHPLGNNTVNRQAHLRLDNGVLYLTYRMDQAEIPTLIAVQDADRNDDGIVSASEWDDHAAEWARRSAHHLEIRIDERLVVLEPVRFEHSLQAGAAELNTLRLTAHWRAAIAGGDHRLAYRDHNLPKQAGWKEIWLDAGSGWRIEQVAGAATHDRSQGLSVFAATSAADMPDELSAHAELGWLPQPTAAPERQSAASVRVDVSPRTGQRVTRASTHAAADSSMAKPPILARPGPPAEPPPGAKTGARPTRAWHQQALDYFRLGVHHIATGWDHLVFLLGLLLFRQPIGSIVRVVTAFTLAHSLTLGLAASGWLAPPGALVEAAIALTIAYVGLAGLLWPTGRHSAWLALGFGLVHGFGFAGALAESVGPQGLASGDWLLNLASFNLGIEAFQLFLVALAVPILACVARSRWARQVFRAASVAVLGAGLGWFLTRVLAM